MNLKNLCLALLATATLWACTKNEPNFESTKEGYVKLKFDHIVAGKKLVLDDYTYSNKAGEKFTIQTLRYFVSNIRLTDDQGNTFTVPKEQSFFLIDQADEKSLFPLFKAPEANYQKLEFILGVDSLTNTLPLAERTGVLDVAENGMYWEWNSGYIFFKLEGSSSSSKALDHKFRYHIGLFGGYNSPTVNNIKSISIDLKQAGEAKVKENLSTDIHLMTDIGQVFDGKNNIRIAEHSAIMVSGPHQLIAENYSQMFTHDHTHNFQKLNNE